VENSGNIDKLTSCPVIYVWHDLLILESKAGFETPKMPFVEVTNPFATGMIYYCPALPSLPWVDGCAPKFTLVFLNPLRARARRSECARLSQVWKRKPIVPIWNKLLLIGYACVAFFFKSIAKAETDNRG